MSAEEKKRGIRTAYADGAYTGAGQVARLVEFDRWIAEVERVAAEKALTDAAEATEEEAPGEPHAGATFVTHAAWLRARAEAYRQERKEQ